MDDVLRINRFLSSFVAVAMVVAVACGSDDAPATSVPATSAPFVAPTSIGAASEFSSTDVTLFGLGSLKEAPAALGIDSPILSASEVEQIWTEWFSNTAVVIPDGSFAEYCEGGMGYWAFDTLFPELDGTSFTWTVKKPVSTRWNFATVVWSGNEFFDGFGAGLSLGPEGIIAISQADWLVFENPECGP